MTNTTQPDPQVTQCHRHGITLPCLLCGSLYAADLLPPRLLTVADVPAGQGPASLLITSSGGRPALWFKADDGTLHFIRWAAGPGDTPAARALWDHLVATIPHVTSKEGA